MRVTTLRMSDAGTDSVLETSIDAHCDFFDPSRHMHRKKSHLQGDAGVCADAALVQTNLLYVPAGEWIWLIRCSKWLVYGLLEATSRPRSALYDTWRRQGPAHVSSSRYHLLAITSIYSVLTQTALFITVMPSSADWLHYLNRPFSFRLPFLSPSC